MSGIIQFADPPKKKPRSPTRPVLWLHVVESHSQPMGNVYGRLGDLTSRHEPLFSSPLRQVWNASDVQDTAATLPLQPARPASTLDIPNSDHALTQKYGFGRHLRTGEVEFLGENTLVNAGPQPQMEDDQSWQAKYGPGKRIGAIRESN